MRHLLDHVPRAWRGLSTIPGGLVPVTHDVGLRISWNNRPPASVRPEVSDKKLRR